MKASKGFSLIEILVVLVIAGILAAITMHTIQNSIEQTKAQSAKNNLLAVSAAQERFFEDWNSYCISTGTNPTSKTTYCADALTDININLRLSMPTTDPFSYSCTLSSAPFICTATDGTVTLTTTGTGVTCTAGGGACPS